MANHPNTFENVKEAMLRLRRTVVVYDGVPFVVVAITNHKGDGKFRIYLDPIGRDPNVPYQPPQPEQFPPEHPGIGGYMDEWIKSNPDSGVIRKQMDSPLFNKFRPYPLGMCNLKGEGTYYVERMPNRKTEQGLTSSMLYETPIDLALRPVRRAGSFNIYGPAFKSCVIGEYPSAQECLVNLLDPDITNTAAAFHREFALLRGPIGMIFLAYKSDVVGVLPSSDLSSVRLGREFKHTKEVVQGLGLFSSIV